MKHLPQPRSLVIGILIAVLYFGFRKLGLLLAIGGGVTPLSPSLAVAWALLLLLGTEYWPAIFLAGLLSSLTFGFPWVIAVGLAAATAIKVIAGVQLFSWFRRFRKQLGHFEFLVAGLSTALVTPLLGATLTFAVQRLSSARPGRDLPTWNTLWLEDMLAILIAAAVVIPMLEPIRSGWKDWDLGRLVRISLITVTVACVSWLVIVKTPSYPALFFLLPSLLFLSVWIEARASGLAATAIVAIAIWGVEMGHGPLAGGSASERANTLTFFVVSVMVNSLAIWCFSRSRTLPLAGSIVLGGCFLAGLLFLSLDGNRIETDRRHFEGVVESARAEMKQRLDEYQSVLRGASQYLSGAPRINRAMWHVYVENLHLLDRYSDASAMSVVVPVDSDQLEGFAAEQQALNHAEFHIHAAVGGTDKPTSEHFIVTAIEPTAINPAAYGSDQGTDTLRKQAIEMARDHGDPALSRPIRVIRNGQPFTAFALFVPVYRAGATLNTVAERRAAFIAVTNSMFGTKEFFDRAFLAQPGQLEMSVFDGTAAGANLMYRSAGQSSSPSFERTDQMTFGGTTWTIGWNRGRDFGPISRTPGAWVVGGVELVSLLLAGIIMILQSNGRRTEAIVQERTVANNQLHDANVQLSQAKAEADAASRAKSTFLSTMSHEIRTPMNAILGYAQLMLRDPDLGAEAKVNLKIICRSGEHLLTLINDVLDMSKIEAGHTELNPATFHLFRLLDDLAVMFRLRAEAKALRFEMLVDGEAIPYVVGDEGKIRQVLINLLGNAIKFTHFGQIKLRITLEQRKPDQLWLSARVQDTGSGMTAEEQQKLFESFSQTRSGLNSLMGTGLGLAISRRYARLMGGDITVTSKPGSGSAFLFEIPIGHGDAGVALKRSSHRRVRAIRTGQDAPKVLVVDDHPENRDWLIKLLTSIGFLLREADNGEAAVRSWEEWNPRLILMDVHMPVMDGLEATRRIKGDPRGKETVIVALTASAMDEDRRAVFQSGADDFVAKPCNEGELLETMRALLNIAYDYEEMNEAEDQHVAGATVLSAERLERLPLELVEELRNATLSGNKKLLDKLILKVREAGDDDSAHALQQLADKYEYDTLTRLLEFKHANSD